METLRFEELGICPEIQKAVKHMGFEEASPIQSKAIPVMMTGKDIIGQAQTGTGKTAAFGIPDAWKRLTRKIKNCRDHFSARQENLPFRWQRRFGIWQSICMGLKYFRFTEGRRL